MGLRWWFYFSWQIFPSVGQQILVVSLFCAITIVGLLLLILDTGSFLSRRKSSSQLAAFLMSLGVILFILGLFFIWEENRLWEYDVIGKGRTVSSETLTLHMLDISWATLGLLSSSIWFIYGLLIAISSLKGIASQPQKKIGFEEPWTKCPEGLLEKYKIQYPHNPEGVLEWHIRKKMKENKAREQAIKELEEETTKKQISSGDVF